MMNESEMDESLGSASDHAPLSNLIDDLYFLKCSLIKDGKLTSESFSYFQQVKNLLKAQPDLCRSIVEWKFLEKELLYFLRGPKFKEALELATMLISSTRKAPNLYYTRKFLFFITDKLYTALGGKSNSKNCTGQTVEDFNLFEDSYPGNKDLTVDFDKEAQNLLDDLENAENMMLNSSLGSSQIRNSVNIAENEFSHPPFSEFINADLSEKPNKINMEMGKLIMLFVTELVKINKTAAHILYELSFFELANVLICGETAEMFNSVFNGVSYPYVKSSGSCKESWVQDGVYEVHRKHFDSEIMFRNKDYFTPKTVVEHLIAGVYDQIYQQCTNIRDFADISFKACLDLVLYKKIAYNSNDLDDLIIEGKNPKVFRFYRRSLDLGSLPDEKLLNAVIKAVDTPELVRDAVLCLFYFIDYISNAKPFTESRIRNIFECLEYHCEHECFQKKSNLKIDLFSSPSHKLSQASELPPSSFVHSFDSNMANTQIFGNTCDDGLYKNPADIAPTKKSIKSVLDDFSEFDNDLDNKNAVANQPEATSQFYHCDRSKIIALLKHLYTISNKNYFFKPSYLILMSYSLSHVPEESKFILEFYKDFLFFCKKDPKNIARAFLSLDSKEIKPKMRKIEMEDSASDFYGIKDAYEGVESIAVAADPFAPRSPKAESSGNGLKLVKNVIESDEE